MEEAENCSPFKVFVRRMFVHTAEMIKGGEAEGRDADKNMVYKNSVIRVREMNYKIWLCSEDDKLQLLLFSK